MRALHSTHEGELRPGAAPLCVTYLLRRVRDDVVDTDAPRHPGEGLEPPLRLHRILGAELVAPVCRRDLEGRLSKGLLVLLVLVLVFKSCAVIWKAALARGC